MPRPRPGQQLEKAKDVKKTTKRLITGYLGKYKIALIIVFIFAIGSTIFSIIGEIQCLLESEYKSSNRPNSHTLIWSTNYSSLAENASKNQCSRAHHSMLALGHGRSKAWLVCGRTVRKLWNVR